MSNSALLKLSDQYQINEDSFMRTTLRTVPKEKNEQDHIEERREK